jgi:hypothetical protein
MAGSARVLTPLFVLVFAAAHTAHAIVDDTLVPEYAVNETLGIDNKAKEKQTDPVTERKQRFEAARARAEAIYRLPPEKIAALAEGKLTDAELSAATAEGAPPPPAPAPETFPYGRLVRLGIAGVAALVLGIVLRVQRQRNTAAVERPRSEARPVDRTHVIR